MIEYIEVIWNLTSTYIPHNIISIFLALLLGMFMGLEREWSDKPAGVRTFSLLSIIGSLTIIIDKLYISIVGGILVLIISILLGLKGVLTFVNRKQYNVNLDNKENLIVLSLENKYKSKKNLHEEIGIDDLEKKLEKLKDLNIIELNNDKVKLTGYGEFIKGTIADKYYTGLSLTTSVSLLLAYLVGIMVALNLYIEAVSVTIISSLILLLKNELHKFAWGISKRELRSALSFGILAFIIFPLLPNKNIGPLDSINPVTIWTLIVAISAIGFINYILILKYRDKGLIVSSFLGGLVNSTSVVADIANKSKNFSKDMSISCITLSNSSMVLRNLFILILFLPFKMDLIFVLLPLVVLIITGLIISYYYKGGEGTIDIENINSPFSLSNSLYFGFLFFVVIIISSVAEYYLGSRGFLTASALSGLVSSGTSTTTAIALYLNGQINLFTAVNGVLFGTISSILIKSAYIYKKDKKLSYSVLKYSVIMVFISVISLIISYLLFNF